ncbi:MAG: zinc ribbon domain-containing protein, partial [bacterium]|nr:zinc ribbon domain-containing protein [bacterium]
MSDSWSGGGPIDRSNPVGPGIRSGYTKPLPTVTPEDRDFWAAARERRFVLPKCRACGHVWFPPY